MHYKREETYVQMINALVKTKHKINVIYKRYTQFLLQSLGGGVS